MITQETRKHAKCSFSKLKNLSICPSYLPDYSDDLHPITESGTRCHLATETGDMSKLSQEEVELVEYCHEFLKRSDKHLAFKWDLELKEEKLETHEPDCYGYADLIQLSFGEGIARSIDWKFGKRKVDEARKNRQGHAIALGIFMRWPQINVVQIIFVHPRLKVESASIFSRNDIDWLKKDISEIVQKVNQGGIYNYDVQNCTYCGNKADCPIINSKAIELRNANTPHLLPLQFDLTKVKTPAQLAALLDIRPILESWAKQIGSFVLKKRLNEGIEIPGYDLTTKNGSLVILDVPKAVELAKEKGLTEEETNALLKISGPDLAEAVGKKAPRGLKKKEEDAFRELLIEKGVCRRPEEIFYLKKVESQEPKKLTN